MTEEELRILTRDELIAKRKMFFNHLVFDEFRICNGTLRPDIVAIGRNTNYCFELKAEFDRDLRLVSQIESYRAHFDKVFLVIDINNPIARSAELKLLNVEILTAGPRGLRTRVRSSKAAVSDKNNIAKLVTPTELIPRLAKTFGVTQSEAFRTFSGLIAKTTNAEIREMVYDICRNRNSDSKAFSVTHHSSNGAIVFDDDHFMELLAKDGKAFDAA